ncbi:MAG: O-antigen ligase family protein [Lachnospiraceae bacterium]|nr:O-antigen ligase family protein [Lachnospiraceae bacterium]
MPKKNKYVKPGRFKLELIPIMAVLGIVPIVVFEHTYATGLENLSFIDNYEKADFFLAWKMFIFTALTFAMACVTIYKLYREGKKIRFEKVFIPLGVYAFFALLSALFSEYQPLPFTGSYEQFESVFAIMGYAVTAYYAYLYIETEKDLKIILAALSFSVICMLLIGLTQAFFTDFYQTDFGKHLILSPDKWDTADELIFNFEKGRVYMSLYNPNYVGSFVSFLFPIYIMLALNKWKFRFAMIPGCIAVAIGLILVLLGSQSRAGFVGVILSLILLLVVMNKKLLRFFIPILLAVLLILTAINKMNADADNYYLNRLLSIFEHTESQEPNFSALSNDGEQLHITYCGNTLNIEFDYNGETGEYTFHLTDEDGNGVNAENADEEWIVPVDERFSMLKIRAVGLEMYNTAGYGVLIDGKEWYFMNTGSEVKVLSGQLKPAKIQTAEVFEPLRGKETFASNRGYIWGRTIPLLKKNFFIGSGPDTFTNEFPNEDYRSAYYSGYENTIITKPHNMYLQIGVQTGVLSLIAVLVFYGWYFVLAISTYTRIKKLDFFGLTGVGIFLGSFGYMVTQMINDSSITVAPIFWTMMGVGIALLFKTRKELKEQIAQDKEIKMQKKLLKQQNTAEGEAIPDAGDETGDTANSDAVDKAENPANSNAGDMPEIAVDTAASVKTDNGKYSENGKNIGTTVVETRAATDGNNKNKRKGSASRKGRRSR